jgi:hypothetical protein
LILYVNGDSHTAGAEAINSHAFAEDDPLYHALGKVPHPDNEKVSYGCLLANAFFAILHCDAESGSSNDRIIRTTQDYIKTEKPDAVVIGWSTWEREEFLIDDYYYQFSAGRRISDWPKHVEQEYKSWVIGANPIAKAKEQHDKIHAFHMELVNQNIPHLFFNSFHSFNHSSITPVDWSNSYIDPYNDLGTYYHWLKAHGYNTVNPNSYHFGADAHRAWAEFLLPHLTNLI